MGFGVSASASTGLTGAGHRARALHPVLPPGNLSQEDLGQPVHEEVEARPWQELVQLPIPDFTRTAHVRGPAPLLHHHQHGVLVKLGPDYLVSCIRVQSVQIVPDSPAQGSVLEIDLYRGRILRDKAEGQ